MRGLCLRGGGAGGGRTGHPTRVIRVEGENWKKRREKLRVSWPFPGRPVGGGGGGRNVTPIHGSAPPPF